jgi:hypothetical protein
MNNNTNIYYLKKYAPIYRVGKSIDIGLIGTDNFIKINYNEQNIKQLTKLTDLGISLDEINSCILYKNLHNKSLLDLYNLELFDNMPLRNILFFDFKNIPFDTNLLNKKILIFGAGAAGGTIAYLLAQFGYQNISISDNDIVEQSDIQKTFIYRKDNLHYKKVESLKKIILENFNICINPLDVAPSAQKEIANIIDQESPELVIKACDPNLSFRYYLNEILFDREIPFIYMSYSFDRINIGPFFVPGVTKSDTVIEKNLVKMYGEDYRFLNYEKLFNNYTIHPSISFNINILANFVLKEIILFHLKKLEFVISINKEVFFNPLTFQTYFRSLDKI